MGLPTTVVVPKWFQIYSPWCEGILYIVDSPLVT